MELKTASKAFAAFLAMGAAIAAAADKPVKVYILSGQSNMVGIGQVDGGGVRWGKEFSGLTLSIYDGAPDAAADYDQMKPLRTIALAGVGGVNPEH